MKRGGRYSAADRATKLVFNLACPEAPKSLSGEARAVWKETVAAFKPDWFAGGKPCWRLIARRLS